MRQTPLGANGCGAPVGGLSVALRGFGGAGGFFVAETHPLRFKGSGIVPAEGDQNLRQNTVLAQGGPPRAKPACATTWMMGRRASPRLSRRRRNSGEAAYSTAKVPRSREGQTRSGRT